MKCGDTAMKCGDTAVKRGDTAMKLRRGSTAKYLQRGLTLLEVLISMSIMSILVTVIGYAISSGLRVGQESRLNQNAAEVAQAIIERYRTFWREDLPYKCKMEPDVTALKNKFSSSYSVNINIAAAFNPDGSFAAEPNCSDRDNVIGNVPPLRQIVVTISQGSRVRARLETKIGDPNP